MSDKILPTGVPYANPGLTDEIVFFSASDGFRPRRSTLSGILSPEIQAETFQYKISVTVGSTNADYTTDGIADNIQINQAISDVSASGGGIVFVKNLCNISGRITPKSNVTLLGEGMGVTTLMGGVAEDWMFHNDLALKNFHVMDMTLDCNNISKGSLLSINKASGCVVSGVEFKNVATEGWMARLGGDNALNPIDCFDNKFIDCVFDTHAGDLEMLLLMNAISTKVVRCKFTNKTTTGPILGLYQQLLHTQILDCDWVDNVGFAGYYSLSCDYTLIQGNYIKNTPGFKGANLADNGSFGYTSVNGIDFIANIFQGGTNTISSTAIEFGAVNNGRIIGNTISKYSNPIVIDAGNTGVDTLSINWTIVDNSIFNNTASNVDHAINPGIFFVGIGGNCYGTITNNRFYDTQGTPTQRFPITFYGAFTWNEIAISDNRLSAYSGGTSIGLLDSATLGANVHIYNNQNYSGSSPSQMLLSNKASLTGGNAFTGDQTFTGKIISSNSASLEIATGGGDTPNALNIGSGGAYIGQSNGHMRMKSGFSGKNFDLQDSNGDIQMSVALDSGKITFATGSNKATGSSTLVGGTVTVSNTLVTATSIILFTRITAGGTPGNITYTRSAGTSFTINSDSSTDTSTYGWVIFN